MRSRSPCRRKLPSIAVSTCSVAPMPRISLARALNGARLFAAVARITAPVFFIHAANDFSLSAGKQLDARLEQLGKPHRLKIYPPVGHTADEGHAFLYLGVSTWEPDVF